MERPKDKLALSLKDKDGEVSKSPIVDALVKDLTKKKDKLEKDLVPHREFYEKHVNDKKFIEVKKKIKTIQAELGPVLNELAAIARTNGKNKSINIEPGEYAGK